MIHFNPIQSIWCPIMNAKCYVPIPIRDPVIPPPLLVTTHTTLVPKRTPSISNKRSTHTNVNSQFRSKRPSQLNTISSPPTTTNVNTNANATTTTGAEKLTSIHPPPISSSATSTSYHRPPSWNYYGAIQFFFQMIQLCLFQTILIFLFTLSPPIGNRTRTSSMESESPATIITANRYPIYLDWIIVKAVQVVTYPR